MTEPKCENCKWYVHMSLEQPPVIEINNRYILTDTRICALGCCRDYSKFEEENKNESNN